MKLINRQRFSLFIGWSGAVSQAIAKALSTWLTGIIPFADPWISSQDIIGGKQWDPQLESTLRNCHGGIFCVTAENAKSEWLHFEAGGLYLRPDHPLLLPYLFDVSNEKLSAPFAKFQTRTATLEGTASLVRDILRHAKVSPAQTKKIIEAATNKYPLLEKKLQDIRDAYGAPIEHAYLLGAGTSLDFHKVIDDKTNDVIIAAQNLQSLLRGGVLPFLHTYFTKNPIFKVLIILTKPEFFNMLAFSLKEKKDYQLQFVNTLKHLNEFKSSLPIKRQKDFTVYFHPGVSSLSAIFRDPESSTRGLAAIIPKWATDAEPNNRIFCLIERKSNEFLFNRIYGHIGIMNDPVHSKTLEYMSKQMAMKR